MGEQRYCTCSIFYCPCQTPPPASSSSPSPFLSSHQSLPRSCILFFLTNRKEKKQENTLCFWDFFNRLQKKGYTFLSPQLLIVFNFIGANFFDISLFHMRLFSLFSFLYLSFLAVSRYLCCVVIVCLPVVIFLKPPSPRTILFMIIVIYIFPFCNYYEKKTSKQNKVQKTIQMFLFFGLGFPVSMGPIMVIVKMNIIDFSASGQ